jgi:MFS transporter, OFA family, oxalate/formate antiporter
VTRQERQGWVIVAGLFVTLLLVFGSGNNASGVFVTPLLRHFGWSHAQVSSLPALLAVSAGVSGALLIGWLLDRLETRAVMVTGVTAAGVSLVMASRANSYPAMLVAYAVLGVGIAAATYLPASMVIAKWFGARRGLAMGIAMSGTTAGGMLMTLVLPAT